MVSPQAFVKTLAENELSPLIGVPCSILAPLIGYVLDSPKVMPYLNPTNEAHAMGLAAGHYLATERVPIVFLQNSGLGNVMNPLTSLHQVYRIPVFLLVTWRGAGGPGTDAPEHDITGRDTEEYLRAFHLPYAILNNENYPDEVARLCVICRTEKRPVAVLVKQGFFSHYERQIEAKRESTFTRYEALGTIKKCLVGYHFLSTTGFTSRESFTIKDSPDFYMLGSMGLISAIGCGVALAQQGKLIAVLDSDGAILMHLGLIPFIGNLKPPNILHFILDNETYASTENQPTVSCSVEFDKLALASGYRQAYRVDSNHGLESLLKSIHQSAGPVLIWIKVSATNQSGTGRVTYSPEDIKHYFMRAIREPDNK